MSFPRYPAYKESGFGWVERIPAQWDCLAGRRVFRQVRELPIDGDVQLSATQKYGVVPQTLFMEMEDQKVALALGGVGNFKRVKENDFVISLRSFQGGIEHSKYNGCVSPAYTVLRLTMPCQPAYLAYLLKSPGYVIALQSVTDGIRDGKNISYEQFGVIGLPIPSLDEQQAIATFLDHETTKIDALVAEQERLIELLKEKRQAVISHAVTKGLDPSVPMKDSGVEWLGEVPAHWEVRALRRVVSAIEQGWSPECYAREAEEQEWGVLKAGCVNGGTFRAAENKALPPELTPEESYEVRAGDVLMSRASGTPELVGSTALVTTTRPRLMLSDKIFRLKLYETVCAPFFVATLNSRAMRIQIENALSGGNGMANNLPQSSLLTFHMAVPPQSEQAAITAFLDQEIARIDVLMNEGVLSIELLRERRTALISSAVAGQIDVRGWTPPSDAP